jgi:hypothetical protein
MNTGCPFKCVILNFVVFNLAGDSDGWNITKHGSILIMGMKSCPSDPEESCAIK